MFLPGTEVKFLSRLPPKGEVGWETSTCLGPAHPALYAGTAGHHADLPGGSQPSS